MDSSNTPKVDSVEGLRAAFRLSADHLHQLLSLIDVESNSPSMGTIDRAFAAHQDITEKLTKAVRHRNSSGAIRDTLPQSADLKIGRPQVEVPSRPHSQQAKLGPLPRFVPVDHTRGKNEL